ncbi:hypothetical protein NCCP1664_07010 [Zafaria cholistanensis]|uniref:Glycosyltransferase RgtA/B/C/D-like domain-containing protein n=1 Tax=Zafaria cholistanensis TaxID=1682741 RepID=A0A5A7NMN1_9MICC|nr:hypothetical protein [Zafaria cholistanensis]GER22204.1 hypothetical protein NCCP1664_07010 [Zafaria cholistanensis]
MPLARAENLAESDTFWQVRTGLATLAQQRIPTADPFSWTAHGESWTLNSWGFNVAVAAVYQAGGLPGVALACAVLVAGIGALVLVLARSLGASPLVSGWLLVLCSPLLIAWLSARPQLVDYAAVLALVLLLRRLVGAGRPAGPLVGLAALAVAVRRGDAVFAAALAVAACGSLAAVRILPVLLLLALPVLASFASRPAVLEYATSRRLLTQAAAGGLAAAVALTAVHLPSLGRPDPAKYPTAAIDAIPSGCRLFNDYLLGGLVLLEQPDVPVSLDSRNDLYGEDHVKRSLLVLDGQGDLEEGLAGAGCVLVLPARGLAQRLRESANWELVSAEAAAQLFVRR